MKNLKKIIVAASLCAAIGATAIAGTLAYFTDEDAATNVFTAGDLDIELEEPEWDSANGVDVVPGRVIEKDPTVTVKADSVDSYVRVTLTMPKSIYDLSNLSGAETPLVIFQNQDATSGDYYDELARSWEYNETASTIGEDTVVLVYDYFQKVATAGSATGDDLVLDAIFDRVFFSTDIKNTTEDGVPTGDYAALQEFSVDVKAYATQAEGFTDADSAFDAAFPGIF